MPTPDDDSLLAAELALGVLAGEARAEALRRRLRDPAFAAAVAAWDARLAPLHAETEDVVPPAGLEARILDRIDAPVAVARGGAVRTVRRWQALAATMTALAAGLLLVLLLRPAAPALPLPLPSASATLVAALAPATAGPPVAAVYDDAAGEVRLPAAAFASAGRSAQLWAIAGDGVPRPIGLLHDGAPTRLPVSAALRGHMAAGVTLAVSIEPRGGSPTGLPTGPVVASGKLSAA